MSGLVSALSVIRGREVFPDFEKTLTIRPASLDLTFTDTVFLSEEALTSALLLLTKDINLFAQREFNSRFSHTDLGDDFNGLKCVFRIVSVCSSSIFGQARESSETLLTRPFRQVSNAKFHLLFTSQNFQANFGVFNLSSFDENVRTDGTDRRRVSPALFCNQASTTGCLHVTPPNAQRSPRSE